MNQLGTEIGLHHGGRGLEGRPGVPLYLRMAEAAIGLSLMNARGSLGQGFFRGPDRRQGFINNLNRLGTGQGLRPAAGRHQGHRVTEDLDLAVAQHRLIGYQVFDPIGPPDVLGRHDPHDPGQGQGRAGFDGDDSGMMMGTANGGQMQGLLQRQVGGELGCSAGPQIGGRPGQGNPDQTPRQIGAKDLRRGLLPQEAAGQLHGFDNLPVAGAAAEIAAQGLFDGLLRRVRIAVQQGLGGHDHPGGTETALDGPGQHKGFLNQMGVFRGTETLDGDHLGSVQIDRLFQAGFHGLPVDDDRAGPALAFPVAGLFGSGQPQVLAQDLQQDSGRVHDQLPIDSIHF